MYVEIYFAKLNVAFAERLIINLIIELHLSILLLIIRIMKPVVSHPILEII